MKVEVEIVGSERHTSDAMAAQLQQTVKHRLENDWTLLDSISRGGSFYLIFVKK